MLTSNRRAPQNDAFKTRLFGLVASAVIMVGSLGFPVSAQVKIVAEVNGTVITNYQVDQRAAFLSMITNLEDSKTNRRQIRSDAQQMLIDEVLKLGAAKAVDPTLATRAREPARQLINDNFAQDGKSGIQVLRENGIDAENIQEKFITDIAWSEFIKFKFENKFKNLDASVDKTIERLEGNAKAPQLKLSEIILLPEPNRPLAATLNLAEEIIKAVGRGADFNAIARQYSAAGTASKGGAVGWIMVDQLPEDIQKRLKTTPIGGITKPLQRDGVVILMRKEGAMENGIADPGQDIVSLARATITLPKTASNADTLEAAARLERETATINSCEAMEALNKRYESPIPSLVKNITLASLNPQLQEKIGTLEVNVPSAPIAFAEGVSAIMLCERIKPQVSLPSREEIYRAELDKVFGILSERYLLRLRRAAIITIK